MMVRILSITFLIQVFVISSGQGQHVQPGQLHIQPGQHVQPGQQVQPDHPQGHQPGQPIVSQPGQWAGQPVQMNQGGNPNIIKVQTQDKDHIMEHLDGVIDKPENEMTPEELQQHYFKLHDYDGNNKLDGNELIQAITHYQSDNEPNKGIMGEEEIMSLLDPIFGNEDRNWDGYIDYPEYAKSQRN